MLPYFRELVGHIRALGRRQNNQQRRRNSVTASMITTSNWRLRKRKAPHQRLLPLIFWATLFSGLTVFLSSGEQAFASDELPPIVISEVHYKPDPVTEWSEFVEVHNAGEAPVDLSGWLLDGGVRYLFPAGSIVAPNAYLVIAQDPVAYAARFGQAPAGQFQGKLGNDKEQIILRDNTAAIVDEVAYAFGFPWPTVGMAPGNSIQLIHPSLDNAQPGAWRSAMPSSRRSQPRPRRQCTALHRPGFL